MHKLSRISLGLAITLGASVYGQAQTQTPAHAGDPHTNIPNHRRESHGSRGKL
jgi:hypothetical protein